MTTEMITLKLENTFLKEIDNIVADNNYHSRTEFIRSALREKIDEVKLKKTMIELGHLKGAFKRKIQTTNEEYERAREIAVEKISQKFK